MDATSSFDLIIKRSESDEENPSPVLSSPPSFIELSPMIVNSNYMTPFMDTALPDWVPQAPSLLQEPVASNLDLNFQSLQNSGPSTFQQHMFSPPYIPVNYPLSSFDVPTPEFIPNPYLEGTVTVSPPRPQIQFSPSIPTDNYYEISPSHLYNSELSMQDHTSHMAAYHLINDSTSTIPLESISQEYILPESIPEESILPESNPEESILPESNPEVSILRESIPQEPISEITTAESNSLVSSSTGSPVESQGHRYECVDCGKSYATSAGLNRHRKSPCNLVSASQSNFCAKCKYCDKVYVSLGALKMHIRTHTLPYPCHLCGKAFSNSWILKGHIRTHTGEKPFACPHCTRAYADRSNFRAHLRSHSETKDKEFNCNVCCKNFPRMSALLKHNNEGCIAAPREDTLDTTPEEDSMDTAPEDTLDKASQDSVNIALQKDGLKIGMRKACVKV